MYKLKLLSVLFVLVSTFSTQAQFAAGAKLGTNLNKFEDTARRLGYSAGGYASYDVLDFLTVRGEVQYLSYAAGLDSFEESFEGYTVAHENRNIRFHTIELPVMAHIKLPIMEENTPTFYVGYAYGYTLSAFLIEDRIYSFEQVTDTPPVEGEEPPTTDYAFKNESSNVTSSVSKSNSSILFGLTFSFDVGMPMTVDLRYQRGLTEMNNLNSLSSEGSPGSLKSRMYSISLSTKLF